MALSFVAGLGALTFTFVQSSLERNDQLASVLALYVGILSLAVGVWQIVRQRRAVTPGGEPVPEAELQEKATALARVLVGFWTREAADRGLHDADPIPVRWRATDRPVLGDMSGVVRGAGQLTALRGEGDITDAVQRFLGLSPGRLVVLGDAGAGKTFLAVILLIGVARRRRAADPVPYLVSAASWNPRRERLRTWLVRRLAEEHYSGDTRVPRALVEAGMILPVVDGLDEIDPALQPLAIRGLRADVVTTAPLILTSLADAYEHAVAETGGGIDDAIVVELQPLEAEQVVDYLRAAPGRSGDAARTAVASALTTPLTVSLLRSVWTVDGDLPGELARAAGRPGDVEDVIFDALVTRAFPADEPEASWDGRTAVPAFSFIARFLERRQARDIEWWSLTDAVPKAVMGGVVTVVGVLAVALMVSRVIDDFLVFSVVAGVLGGIAATIANRPTPVSGDIRVRGRLGSLLGRVGRGVAGGIGIGLVVSLFSGMLLAANYALTHDSGLRAVVAGSESWAGRGAGILIACVFGIVIGGLVSVAGAVIVGLAQGLRRGVRTGMSVFSSLGFVVTFLFGIYLSGVEGRREFLSGLGEAKERVAPFGGGLVDVVVSGLTTTELSAEILNQLLFAAPMFTTVFAVLGLVFGVVAATRLAARTPLDVREVARPLDVWRADRRATFTQAAAVFVAVAVVWSGVMTVFWDGRPDWWTVLLFAAGCATYSVCFTAWFRFEVARLYLPLVHGLPRDLLGLLEAGHDRQLLRQVGPRYQFRHGKLQHHLASAPRRG